MAYVARDLQKSSGPTRDTQNCLSRTMSRLLLSRSEEGDSTTSFGNLYKCLLMFRGNFPCFSLCPLPLVLSLGTAKKSLVLSCFYPPLRYLYTLAKFSSQPPFLLAEQLWVSQPFLTEEMLQWFHYLCGPSLYSLQQVHVLYWVAQNRRQYSRCSFIRTEQRGRISSLSLLAMCADAVQISPTVFSSSSTLLTHIQFGVHQDIQVHFRQSACQLGWPSAWGCSSPVAGLCTSQ